MTLTLSRDTRLAAALSVASLTLWFGLGFPWAHHNESLVWVVDMAGRSFSDAFAAHPIRPVQSYRPLGVAQAWASYAASGGIWLQQLLNFGFTVGAWWLAVRASNARLAFGFAALLCLAGFFSGFIYLFHLHGVFYGPLLLFLSYLLVVERQPPATDWKRGLGLFAWGLVAAMFHTFALLMFAAYVGAAWLEFRLNETRRSPWASGLWVPLGLIAVAAAVTKLLVAGSSDLGSADPILGLLTSYRAVELSPVLSVLAATLALAASVIGSAGSAAALRWGMLVATALTSAVLYGAGLPVLFGWIVICALRALLQRRLRMLALIGICALLPVVTSTGSPTYCVFVLMPCLLMTVDGLVIPPTRLPLIRGLGLTAVAATAALLVTLRLGIPVPVVDALARPLRAEGEKTHQMMAAFDWLEQQAVLQGQLALCTPADFPIRSGHPLDRQARAPTAAWPFDEYLKVRAERLRDPAGIALRLCFGSSQPDAAVVLQSWPGRWAGAAVLVRMPAEALQPGEVPAAAAGADTTAANAEPATDLRPTAAR